VHHLFRVGRGVGDEDVEMFNFLPLMTEKMLGSQRSTCNVSPCGWLPLESDSVMMPARAMAKNRLKQGCDSQ